MNESVAKAALLFKETFKPHNQGRFGIPSAADCLEAHKRQRLAVTAGGNETASAKCAMLSKGRVLFWNVAG